MPELVARGLSWTYPSGVSAGPLDLEVGPGVVHLRGPNGSGKSTLLRCLCGAHRSARGSLAIDGLDPRTSLEGRRRVAYVSAEPELPPFLTVDEAWRELAAIRGAPGWDGAAWRARLGVPGDLLLAHASAGQRALAELLAGLAGDPPVLLLDEPFANLDPTRGAVVAGVVSALRGERVIVCTHHGALPIAADVVVELPAR